jgi:hypothetical protein
MGYDIGTSKIAFLFLEDLFVQLRFFAIRKWGRFKAL